MKRVVGINYIKKSRKFTCFPLGKFISVFDKDERHPFDERFIPNTEKNMKRLLEVKGTPEFLNGLYIWDY